jgi:hypothetical protein
MTTGSREIWWRWAVGRYSAAGQVHLGDLVVLGQRRLAIFGLQCVDVD